LWKRLERDAGGYLYTGSEHRDAAHHDDIEASQRAGTVRTDIAPREVWEVLIAMAAAWAQGSITTVAAPEDDDATHRRRRDALTAAVRGAFGPR
jgi:hypothetical protein